MLLPAAAGAWSKSDPVVTVSVDPAVDMPAAPSYMTPEQRKAQALGAVVGGVPGAAVGESIGTPASDELLRKIAAIPVNPAAILVDEMRKALAARLAKEKGVRAVDQGGDMVIHFKVMDYGYHAYGLSTSMQVILVIEDEVRSKDGAVLYSDTFGDNPYAPTLTGQSHKSMDDLLADPALIEAWYRRIAAKIAVDQAKGVAYHAGQYSLVLENAAEQ